MILCSPHASVILRRDRTCDLGLPNFVLFPKKIKQFSLIMFDLFDNSQNFGVRFYSTAEINRIKSIERLSSIEFDCVRLKFCTVLFDEICRETIIIGLSNV